jgi:hypothetical protein
VYWAAGIGVMNQLPGLGRAPLPAALPHYDPQRCHDQVRGLGRGRMLGNNPLSKHINEGHIVTQPRCGKR